MTRIERIGDATLYLNDALELLPRQAMKYNDIPQFPQAHYAVDVHLEYLCEHVDGWTCDYGLELIPDFQRGHVWTEAQQIAFTEYHLRGGESGQSLYFNCPGWIQGKRGNFVLVDGLQRLTALQRFAKGEIPAFGCYAPDFDHLGRLSGPRTRWHIAILPTRADVLRWYIALNIGGTPHDPAEIERVQGLLADEERRGAA